MVYIQYEFFTRDEAKRDFIISLLPEVGFDGFEELNSSVRAFISKSAWEEEAVLDILRQNELTDIEFERTTIEQQNWNEQWEKSFQPLLIAGRVSIRAPFHEPQPADYELVIEPKMSFGTGHHPTTALMIEQMLAIDMQGKSVADFGCGTGVLAILADRLGAASIVAIDNEEWAVENSRENLIRNDARSVTVLLGESMEVSRGQYDIMLANINRNIIMKNLHFWRNFLLPGGVLVVSGILVTDTRDISDMAVQSGFSIEKVLTEEGWVSILLKK
jgi:ribosomal protein L11 methyltransferase